MTVEYEPVERKAVLPCSPERLEEALTDPEAVSAWFGARVEWEVTPGGDIHTCDAEGNERCGVVHGVAPGRRSGSGGGPSTMNARPQRSPT